MSIPDRWVLASPDLNARARVLDVAGDREVTVTGAHGFGSRIEGAGLVVLDLDAGGREAVAELVALRAQQALPRVVGFVSHVDRALGDAAREAGCEVFARGRFWSRLGEILGAP